MRAGGPVGSTIGGEGKGGGPEPPNHCLVNSRTAGRFNSYAVVPGMWLAYFGGDRTSWMPTLAPLSA